VSCIHVPIEEIVDAIHRSRKIESFNGANPDRADRTAGFEEEPVSREGIQFQC